MTTTQTHPPVDEMRRFGILGPAGAAQVMLAALARRRTPGNERPGPRGPDRLRADTGLPPVEREMRRHREPK